MIERGKYALLIAVKVRGKPLLCDPICVSTLVLVFKGAELFLALDEKGKQLPKGVCE